MQELSAGQLRQLYFDFFIKRGHRLIPSASLLPENDPTVLFTTAGMHPLVPFLMGQSHPEGKRLVNVQKCVRTQDIEEVGDAWHCTFFEMLGNWSLGDYFKEDAIRFSFEFLTNVLALPVNRLAVTYFAGDPETPPDADSAGIWERLGIPRARIYALGRKDNFWGPVGATGPCGPDTEMFYILRETCDLNNPDCSPACGCGRFVEIWNDVFMQYQKQGDGTFVSLPQKNVDTGMGLLRVAAILSGKKSVYETDVYRPVMEYLEGHPLSERNRRIVADHVQTAMFAIADGIEPSNVGAGYIVRRVLRRALRLTQQAGLDKQCIDLMVERFVRSYDGVYPQLRQKQTEIVAIMRGEEDKFNKALASGLKHLEKELTSLGAGGSATLPGGLAFFMFETYGFPLELTEEIAGERGIKVDRVAFDEAFRVHQERSRSAGDKLFKGGLADHSVASTQLHTATHLLHEALRRVLGPHVEQRGSNITPERLRFDFSHPEKVTPEQLARVEAIVNEQIRRDLPVTLEEMTLDEARQRGAIGLFEDRYGSKVNVYFMGDFSSEVCGGPHVRRTGELGAFKIKKEEASSAGVRRIKAVVRSEAKG